MKEVAEILEAVASLAWPVLVLLLFIKFAGSIKTVVDSAARRKFSLKIAGNELSMDEFSEQQIKLLSDLQAKVAEIENRLSDDRSVIGIEAQPHSEASELSEENSHRILWVDDNPRNNSYIVAVLEERGNRVDIALSTDEAMRMFSVGKYDAVVSDMGRPEGEHAGLDLTRSVRLLDKQIPILIFCGSWAARNMKDEATQTGVNLITSSASKLLTGLAKFGIA